MPEWSETNPLRVVTGYHNVARKFFTEKGFEHVVLLSADGALEAAPLMGTADIILDLVGELPPGELAHLLATCLQRPCGEYHLAVLGRWKCGGVPHEDGVAQLLPAVIQAAFLAGPAPAMQVSTGVTLRENNLKEIEGGRIMNSQGVLVGNAAALRESPQLLAVVHELIERLEVKHVAYCS